MKKFLFIFLAGMLCTTLQSCLEYDEPGDELGLGQLVPEKKTSDDSK